MFNNNDESYNWVYNVAIVSEYNRKTHKSTFSGKLENVDSKYFWFRVDEALACVRQENVEFMIPVNRVSNIESLYPHNAPFLVYVGFDVGLNSTVTILKRGVSNGTTIPNVVTIKDVRCRLFKAKLSGATDDSLHYFVIKEL